MGWGAQGQKAFRERHSPRGAEMARWWRTQATALVKPGWLSLLLADVIKDSDLYTESKGK